MIKFFNIFSKLDWSTRKTELNFFEKFKVSNAKTEKIFFKINKLVSNDSKLSNSARNAKKNWRQNGGFRRELRFRRGFFSVFRVDLFNSENILKN